MRGISQPARQHIRFDSSLGVLHFWRPCCGVCVPFPISVSLACPAEPSNTMASECWCAPRLYSPFCKELRRRVETLRRRCLALPRLAVRKVGEAVLVKPAAKATPHGVVRAHFVPSKSGHRPASTKHIIAQGCGRWRHHYQDSRATPIRCAGRLISSRTPYRFDNRHCAGARKDSGE